ncbi:MAG: recombinase RecA [Firmicutes bacterium]|nr:recombinase RecA [Bacillota bacterium]
MEKKKKSSSTNFAGLSQEEKDKAFEEAIAKIEKQYGKGAIMKMTSDGLANAVEVISTGCLAIDLAIGVGGVPKGRIVEVYGPESSGKTTLTLHIIAEAQKMNGKVAFIDAEHALDPLYASKLGVDLSKLYISQPDSGEQALDITEDLVNSGAVDLIVVDSVAALTPRAEIEGEMGESKMGLHARLMSQALRKLTGAAAKTKTCIIFINQLRAMIGNTYGPSETTTGGKALKFYASLRMEVRKIEQNKDGAAIVGNKTRVKIIKNKLAPPFRTAEFDIIFGKGISNESSLIDLADKFKIINKSGSWYSYKEERLGQGKESVRKLLVENEVLRKEIEEKIKIAVKESDEDFIAEDDGDDTAEE